MRYELDFARVILLCSMHYIPNRSTRSDLRLDITMVPASKHIHEINDKSHTSGRSIETTSSAFLLPQLLHLLHPLLELVVLTLLVRMSLVLFQLAPVYPQQLMTDLAFPWEIVRLKSTSVQRYE